MTIDKDIIITTQDIHDVCFCNKGCRAWFRAHKLCWNEFRRNGLTIKTFIKAQGGLDENLTKLYKNAIKRKKKGG